MAEVGWFQDPTDLNPDCNWYPLGGSDPKRLAIVTVNGHQTCKQNTGSLAGGQSNPFALDDPNADKTWQFFMNGNNVWTHTTNFQYGYVTTNGERYGTADTAHSEFNGLQVESTSGWSDWSNPQCFVDSSNAFDSVIDSATHIEVNNTGSGHTC